MLRPLGHRKGGQGCGRHRGAPRCPCVPRGRCCGQAAAHGRRAVPVRRSRPRDQRTCRETARPVRRDHGHEELVRHAGWPAREAAPKHPPLHRRPGIHDQAHPHHHGRHAHLARQRPHRRQPGRREADGHHRGQQRRSRARRLRRRPARAVADTAWVSSSRA